MRRTWSSPRQFPYEGDERSMALASALAQVCDPETLEGLLHTKTILDRFGGQVFIAAKRDKLDPRSGEPVLDKEAPGVFVTTGYVFHYEHIATALRDTDRAFEPDTKRPVEAQLVTVGNGDGGYPDDDE